MRLLLRFCLERTVRALILGRQTLKFQKKEIMNVCSNEATLGYVGKGGKGDDEKSRGSWVRQK